MDMDEVDENDMPYDEVLTLTKMGGYIRARLPVELGYWHIRLGQGTDDITGRAVALTQCGLVLPLDMLGPARAVRPLDVCPVCEWKEAERATWECPTCG